MKTVYTEGDNVTISHLLSSGIGLVFGTIVRVHLTHIDVDLNSNSSHLGASSYAALPSELEKMTPEEYFLACI
tara:strand:+ start:2474 stop:2692 length:219 start_codon:yes stop_codon:yes gene_type:complete